MSSEVMVSVVTLVTVVTACAGVARLARARASIRAERGWVNFMGPLRAFAGPIERPPAVPCPQTRLGAGQSQSTQVKTHPAHGGDGKKRGAAVGPQDQAAGATQPRGTAPSSRRV